ncbi:retrovirus-related Pol polyprotein from transposon 412 [Trichonephila clavipes]|nr:retrovirus-related Pol polyprotein from transposon 412 [Trichonephila clavipes]
MTQTASDKFNLIDLNPIYDGGESLGIRRFLEKINDVANLGKWSNDEKVTILKLKLAGIAEEFFLSDPTHSQLTEYNDIARILIARFEKAVPLSTRLQLFSSCIQGPSESVQEFAARINKLGTQIFQSGNSAQNTAVRNANDQLLQSRFISGLRNDIRRFVLSRDPLNLDESINAALIEEQNMKLNQIASEERSGLSSAQTENPVLSALADRLEEMNLRAGRLQEASAVTARKSGGNYFNRRENVFKCFYCGIQGHRQAECRKKQRDERAARYQPPRRNAASEYSFSSHPGSEGRHVHFRESDFSDNYAASRHPSSAKLKTKNIHLTNSQIKINPQTNDTILEIRNDSDNIITLNKNMKIITVNNYEDFSSDFPVSQDILPPLTEKDFNLSCLDSKIKSRLFQLLISHKSAFARSTVELSAAATEHHRISLQHDYPIKCPIYKIPFNLRNEFRRQITDLKKAGIISKSNSQYNTPALFVKQKEKWRLVLDFRKLNDITLTQDFVISTLDDILHEISGSNYFSALDMKSAFNQIPLHFADRHKTAFSTPDGGPGRFITQWSFGVYIDDLILFTKTIDEHFELLGFVVTPEGILIDKDKSVSINEFPVPKDQKQIKSFLGCCNFYRRYIKNFAKRALPLTNLLRKDTPFEWTSETQEAFDDIKKAILNPPVLTLPDQNAELQITTDASSRGIGAVLE